MHHGDAHESRIAGEVHELHPRAATMLADPAAVGALLDEVAAAISRDPALAQAAAPLGSLLRAHLAGAYREADPDDLAWALAALMYIASPWDLVPDYLPKGLRDDVLVARYVRERIAETLTAFDGWARPPGRRRRARDAHAAPRPPA